MMDRHELAADPFAGEVEALGERLDGLVVKHRHRATVDHGRPVQVPHLVAREREFLGRPREEPEKIFLRLLDDDRQGIVKVKHIAVAKRGPVRKRDPDLAARVRFHALAVLREIGARKHDPLDLSSRQIGGRREDLFQNHG